MCFLQGAYMNSSFKNAVTGARVAAAGGVLTILMGVGGYLYSAYYAHGTGSAEGLERRGQFCQRDNALCATSREAYSNCMFEKSILGQTARVNSYILMTLGLIIIGGAAVAGLGRKPQGPQSSSGPT